MKCQSWLFPPLAVRRPASTICRTMGSGIGVSLKRRTASTVRIASNVSMEATSFLDSFSNVFDKAIAPGESTEHQVRYKYQPRWYCQPLKHIQMRAQSQFVCKLRLDTGFIINWGPTRATTPRHPKPDPTATQGDRKGRPYPGTMMLTPDFLWTA